MPDDRNRDAWLETLRKTREAAERFREWMQGSPPITNPPSSPPPNIPCE